MLRPTAMYDEPGISYYGLRYNPLKACVVPRPIGWLASVSQRGVI